MNTTLAKAPTFEECIVTALTSDINSNALYDLVQETQLAIVTADNDARVAEAMALDPIASPDPSEARRAMEDARFRATRLRSLLPRLQNRVTEVGNQEEIDQWRERFNPLKTKVENAAAKLASVYQKVTDELVPLFAEIEKLNAEVVQVLAAKPYHASGYLRSVELTARGLKDFPIYSHEIMKMQLPDWQHPTELLWPPNRQMDYSNTIPVYAKQHSGADWWKTQQQDHDDKTVIAEQANAEQTQAEGAARETYHRHRQHDPSDIRNY